jgi:hypothetical protein
MGRARYAATWEYVKKHEVNEEIKDMQPDLLWLRPKLEAHKRRNIRELFNIFPGKASSIDRAQYIAFKPKASLAATICILDGLVDIMKFPRY